MISAISSMAFSDFVLNKKMTFRENSGIKPELFLKMKSKKVVSSYGTRGVEVKIKTLNVWGV